MHIGTIKEIWRFPVKSMFGERVDSARMEARGIADDRCWAVRDETSGEFVGGRKYPKLMMLKARYLQEPLHGFGPAAQSRVQIEFPDGRVIASDDPYASAILSMYLGQRVSLCPRPATRDRKPHRLRKPMSPSEIRYALGMKPDDPDPDFSAWSVQVLATLSRYTTPPGALYDVYPIHFMTTAALDAMRGHYPDGDFRVERYRPNFLIETPADLSGIVENDWSGMDLQIGDARIRCHHPTIRCSMPGAAQPGISKDPMIPQALMRYADQHLGAYASPRNEATIQVGDRVELVPRSPSRVSVWFGLLNRGIKARAIAASNHLLSWQETRARLTAQKTISADPRGFRRLRLVERRDEATDIVSFVFADPQNRPLPRFVPGQHVVLAIPQPGSAPLFRPYSLSSAGDGKHYRITVKRETVEIDGTRRGGLASSWLHDELNVGDSLAMKGPGGQFADIPGDSTPLVLISSGIGITPYLAMLQAIANENPDRQVSLLHGIRSPQDLAFADELARLQSTLRHARFKVFVSQPGHAPLPALAQAGRLEIQEQLVSLKPDSDALYYLCGKPSFTADLLQKLLAAGVPRDRIRMESFGLSQSVDHSDTTRYPLHCSLSQRTLEWDPQQDNLLSFLEAEGLEVSSGCRYGACQACEVTLQSGEVEYPPEIQPPAGKNRILLCSARPKSRLELDL